MKKYIVILLVIQLLLLLSPFCIIGQKETEEYRDYTFNFPSSLETIDEEAFVGTVAETAIIQSNLLKIEKDVFQGANNLKDVYLPDSVLFIADSAFPQNNGLTIHGIEGSYAQKWAEENGFDFIVNDIWTDAHVAEGIHIENLLSLFWIICPVDEKSVLRVIEAIKRFIKSMRPQDRPELYPINYRFP